ncbi:MAG TPA: ATP-binding protein [Vicinamibacterales bacterium]|nr:ATP-binding protein [Vicinamibacterales bacterium]
MFSFTRTRSSAGRLGAYGLTLPAVGVALWAGLLMARTTARPLAATPLALAVALSAGYGGLGPGLFALVQASVAIDFFLIEPGTLFGHLGPAQAAALMAFIVGWTLFCFLAAGAVRQTDRIRDAHLAAESESAHAARMAQLTSALAQARTPRAASEAAVQESLYALRADAAALLLVSPDSGTAEVVRAVGYAPGRTPSAVTLSEKGPISDAVGRGVPVVIETRAARGAEYPASRDPASDRFETAVIVPLLIGSRVVAVIQIEFEAVREVTDHDREYLLALAHGGAQALDRTWQLEVAERGRSDAEQLRAQADRELVERKSVEHALRASETRYRALAARTSRLHALSAALSEAVTMDAVGRAVITHGRTVVGATAGEVLRLVDEGIQFETLHAEADGRGGAEHARVPVEDGLCATAAVRTGRPVFIRSLEDWQQRFWRSASVAADGGYQSSATMPLLVEGAPIGVLTFHFTVPVNFDDEYQALLVSVAEHCAQALDRARLYESTQRARADAERANRIKDEFVSIVSHELRTPLNAILGWTTMLQKGALVPEKSERALRSIHDNASRQARLIEELLDFSRVTSGRASLQMEQVDVRELLRGVVESMIPTAVGRAVDLHLSVVPPVCVRGDIRRLEQVFFNLIDNALKFTSDGGRVAIDVRINGGQVEIQVQDTGTGMEPDFLPHVFDRFRQADTATSRTYGGLGLGMSIAKQLVEAHDGHISARSEGKGLGSTFTVQLPIAARLANETVEGMTSPSQAVEHAETRLDGIRVLVVDDEADAREIMATALEASGASVELAASARAAFEILERTSVDVLVSDIAMPDEDGFALIRKVRASLAGRVASIPAAAVTAFTGAEDRAHALAAGFHLHLAKPFEPTELIRTVDKLAHQVLQ